MQPDQGQGQPAVSSAPGSSDRMVFRLPGALIAWWVWAALAAFTLIDIAVTGRNHTSAVIAVAVVLVTGVMYACALRPRVVADSAAITVHNPLRDHQIPLASVTGVDMAESVRVHTGAEPGAPGDKVIHSWALYAQRRSRIRMEQRLLGPRRPPRSPFAAGGFPAASSTSDAAPETKLPTAQVMANQLNELAKNARLKGTPSGPRVVTWAWSSTAAVVVPAIALILIITLAR
jgi:PH (Pleckstrin Homology) domain-containing protein